VGPTARPSWLERIERTLARGRSGDLGAVWVVAVSGGSDSVGLLRVLHAVAPKAGLTLSVAHLDHGARGEAARADAAFVEDLARSLGLPFDLGRWQATRPGHFEADARRARYAWLLEIAHARGASAVAVGHTRDDQAETVLHRVIRGTGIHGLAGIPARRWLGPGVTLVRPLLNVSRQEVRDYLGNHAQPFRDDVSNADTSRTRARLRHDLLPKLADEYNPRVAEALVNLAKLAAGSTRSCRRQAMEIERFTACGSSKPDEASFHRDRLVQFPAFVRAEVLRLAWRRAGWPEAGMGAKRWRRLALLARRTREGRFDVGGGVEAHTSPALFTLRRTSSPDAAPALANALPLEVPGSAPWRDGRVILTVDPDTDAPRDETIDLDRVFPPLCVRGPAAGDRFGPLGMAGREKPLNDFFRGRSVPREERARTPLVCDRAGILWVVGHRIADRVKLTGSTTRRGALRWEPEASHPI
jgi:tRNA(Ile)-lysidine synthase